MVQIESIESGSIAEELGVEAGDRLLCINGERVEDIVDFQRLTADVFHLLIEIQKPSLQNWELDIEYEPGQVLGFGFEHPRPRSCRNNCQFCFVRQLPHGMRRTLYVRDDDYRFSYLYGAYISLTNLTPDDIERIKLQQLSPLYISVHSTDAEVRARLLQNDKADALGLLHEFAEAGIQMHTQVVLCPGINDGSVLERTIAELFALYPAVRSLAIVPVGLTRFREGLPLLHQVDAGMADKLLCQVDRWQKHCLDRSNTRFVFGADELYLKAKHAVPAYEAYEDFCQIENGVGMLAQFEEQALEVMQEVQPEFCAGVHATLVCGVSASATLQRFVHSFNQKAHARLQLLTVTNSFWGEQVTVSGLLTGADIIAALQFATGRGFDPGVALLLPDVMFKEGADLTLDDMELCAMQQRAGLEIRKVAPTPWALLDAVEELWSVLM